MLDSNFPDIIWIRSMLLIHEMSENPLASAIGGMEKMDDYRVSVNLDT